MNKQNEKQITRHENTQKNKPANFDRNIPTEISGPPPEVIPNIPVGRNRNGPFHLNSDRNFRNLRHNGKHPGAREKILLPYPIRQAARSSKCAVAVSES